MITIGKKAPSFTLPNSEGKKISLQDYIGKWVVLFFYPKDNTPGCTQEACDFRDSFSRLTSVGTVVLGISADSVESHEKFKRKFALPFELLSDESHDVIESYGTWKEKKLYGRTFMGIERSTFLIDPKGNVFKHYSKVKVKGHVDDILTTLTTHISSK